MKNHSTHMSYTHMYLKFKAFIFLIFIHIIASPILSAQGKLVEGYIITTKNDTIRGLIKNEDWTKSPVKIGFKADTEALQILAAADLKGFCIIPTNGIYKSKKICLLDITLHQVYVKNPSLKSKDSIHVFLQEIVSGNGASLFEFLNNTEQSHFFIEKNNVTKELFNYPYYISIENKTHLLILESYKKQLAKFCSDVSKIKLPIPSYKIKYLKEYIEEYNKSFLAQNKTYLADQTRVVFDLETNMGLENWNERGFVVRNKFTLGIGLRVSFPRKFHNRFIKLSYFLTPNALAGYSQAPYEETPLKTIEFGVGSYIGACAIRPYVAFHYSSASRGCRSEFLGMQAGVSYKRRINLEFGHFANFYTIITGTPLFVRPRISLHYMINLNSLQRKTS